MTYARSPLTDLVATRCTSELVAKLDGLADALRARSPVRARVSRSDVARAALELGVVALLGAEASEGTLERRTWVPS